MLQFHRRAKDGRAGCSLYAEKNPFGNCWHFPLAEVLVKIANSTGFFLQKIIFHLNLK
jgi:hypothetical protein